MVNLKKMKCIVGHSWVDKNKIGPNAPTVRVCKKCQKRQKLVQHINNDKRINKWEDF